MTTTVQSRRVKYVRPFLYPKQEAALFDPSRYVVCEASTKSGKTVGCIVWLHERAALFGGPGKNFWWVAPIRRVARIAFRRLKNFLPKGTFKANETEMSVTLANGATIVFLGAEDPDTLYGEDVYAAVIDEATRIKAESWYAVRSTLTATEAPVRIIGNVKGRKNWAFKMARRAQAGARNMHYARLTVWDAVDAGIFSKEEAEDAKANLPESIYKELYMAEPADDSAAFFQTERISIVEDYPRHAKLCRVWDFAVTDETAGGDPDYTVGAKLAYADGQVYILDVTRQRSSPDKVTDHVKTTAALDGPTCKQLFEEEKGAAGKMMVELFKRELAGIKSAGRVLAAPVSGSKVVRAYMFAADLNSGNVSLVHGPWNESFIDELDDFPDGDHDDQVDTAAHGYNHLVPSARTRVRWL